MGSAWRTGIAILVTFLTCAPAIAADPEPLPVHEVAPGVFVYEAPYALASRANDGAIANVGFILGRSAVAVIDTGGSLAAGRRLRAAIRRLTDLPIRYVINTHVHPDHVLGNAAFLPDGPLFVGHRNLPEALAAHAPDYLRTNRKLVGPDFEGSRPVPPTVLVDTALDLDLGGRRLHLQAWPTAHTNTDLTVLDDATSTWFLGDLLFIGHVPALDGRLRGWISVLRALEAHPAARVVPGHGPASVPWPVAAQPIQRYLDRLEADLRRMIRDGQTMSDAAQAAGRSETNRWSLFDEFNARNATAGFQELEWE